MSASTCRDTLIESNVKFVGFVIHKRMSWCLQHASAEDLFQIGCIGLIKAARTFIEGKNSFTSYAVICIQNELRMHIRYLKRRDLEIANCTLINSDAVDNDDPYAYMMNSLIDTSVDFENVLAEQESINMFLTTLDDMTRDILSRRMAGHTQKQISQDMHISQSYISRLINRAFAKYQKHKLKYKEVG